MIMAVDLTMWMLMNVMDVVISIMGVHFGAGEVGFLAGVPGSWTGLTITKMVLALLVGAALLRKNREDLLAVLSLGLAAICIFNGYVFMKQLGI
jgi:hypothetical protein